ncbi:hypothetical protein CIL05_06735 [Virgibacillus profundi]|uniref:Peptidase S74 domain-containing protein n=1 Tax=Virgibacillus profundi TaxID=2024555 RepID=A0A2A2IET7_9BACI|nr:tail fiber domain-containing protein [Virgibacillus profundi]PAV30157.1 hypothetical protein CIL05_06735 [Virgibacillus profundi]PXY54329.1 hypothetical protein CIT14_06820 [Virgibacillus profundi]
MDTRKIYGDPIISQKRKGTHIDPFRKKFESLAVEKHYVILSEVPVKFERVKVSFNNVDLYEVEDEFLSENTFNVDYVNGIVYFHESQTRKTLDFEYMGEGVLLFPDSRIYLTNDLEFPNVRDKFYDVDRGILEQRNRVDTLIRENPQPSELVDIRIDRNGTVFDVARDRINAEQKKIEDAYVDTKAFRHPSLKARIDSIQLAHEERLDDMDDSVTDIWAEFELIPGKISFEVGQITTGLDDRITSLETTMTLLPGEFELRVKGVEEEYNGRVSVLESSISVIPGEIDLKVNADDVISSINLSPEEIVIDSNKIKLVGAVDVLSDITGELGVINAGEINTLIMNGTNRQIYFGNDNVDNFDGRIDYIEPFMRLQKDRYTYYAVRADGAELGGQYSNRIHNMFVGGIPMFSFGYDPVDGHNHRTITSGNSILKFLNGDTIALQVRNGRDDGYAEIHASEFVTGSQRKTKENINMYNKSVLDNIKNTPVYTFKRKSTDSFTSLQDRYHLGFMHEEVPNFMKRGEGVDIVGAIATNFRGTQELIDRVELLEDEITYLRKALNSQ